MTENEGKKMMKKTTKKRLTTVTLYPRFAVVDMDDDHHDVVAFLPEKDGGVILAPGEAQLCHKAAYDSVLFSRRLLQSVDSFEEMENVKFSILFFVFRRLLHEDFFVFVKGPVEKGAVKIKGVHLPSVLSGDGEECSYRGEASNGGECFEIVYSFSLCEPFCDNTSLVFVDFSFQVFL